MWEWLEWMGDGWYPWDCYDYWSTCSANKQHHHHQLHQNHYQGQLHHMLSHNILTSTIIIIVQLQWERCFLTSSNWQLCVDQQVGGNGGLEKYVNAIIWKYFWQLFGNIFDKFQLTVRWSTSWWKWRPREIRQRNYSEILRSFLEKAKFAWIRYTLPCWTTLLCH